MITDERFWVTTALKGRVNEEKLERIASECIFYTRLETIYV